MRQCSTVAPGRAWQQSVLPTRHAELVLFEVKSPRASLSTGIASQFRGGHGHPAHPRVTRVAPLGPGI